MSSSTLANLASLTLNRDYTLGLVISPWLLGAIAILALLYFAVKYFFLRHRGSQFEIDTAEVGLGSGKLSFKPNFADEQIAYKVWVELSTRKIGLSIDLEHDVIAEIYDSWFNFFSITRDLIKEVPVNKVKSKSTRQIINLSIDVLNEGLRPHLTTWQARFRHWYERQLEKAGDDIDPQSLQKKYPRYDELVADIMEVNQRLMNYREKMYQLVLGLPAKK